MASGGGRGTGQQQPGQTPTFGQKGNEAGPSGRGQSNAEPTNGASPDRTGGRGQAQGFDWNMAAQDRSPSGGADALGSDPALVAQPSGDEFAAQGSRGNAENLAPGGAMNRSSPPVQGQPDPPPSGYPAGTFSQEDVDRAKALAGKFSQQDIDRLKALAGNLSQDDIDRAKALSGLSSLVSPSLAEKLVGASRAGGTPSGTSSSSDSNQFRLEQSVRRYAAGRHDAVELVVFVIVERIVRAVRPPEPERELR